jgi:hypothetical protein
MRLINYCEIDVETVCTVYTGRGRVCGPWILLRDSRPTAPRWARESAGDIYADERI